MKLIDATKIQLKIIYRCFMKEIAYNLKNHLIGIQKDILRSDWCNLLLLVQFPRQTQNNSYLKWQVFFMPSDSLLQCYHSNNVIYKRKHLHQFYPPFALVVSGRIYDLEYSKYVLMTVLN